MFQNIYIISCGSLYYVDSRARNGLSWARPDPNTSCARLRPKKFWKTHAQVRSKPNWASLNNPFGPKTRLV